MPSTQPWPSVGVLREMGFPVDAEARMTVDEAVALMHSQDDAIAILDDGQIALAIESYVACERFSIGADYGRYDGDVFFVDAMLEMDRPWASPPTPGATTSEGELRVTALNCRHSELLGLRHPGAVGAAHRCRADEVISPARRPAGSSSSLPGSFRPRPV